MIYLRLQEGLITLEREDFLELEKASTHKNVNTHASTVFCLVTMAFDL